MPSIPPEVSSPESISAIITPTETLSTSAPTLPAPIEPAAPWELSGAKEPYQDASRGTRWYVRQKLGLGQRGWKPGKPGTLMFDFKTWFFPTKKEALAYIRTLGCDCCARPPKRIRASRYYRTGYGDFVMLLPDQPKRRGR